jgi:hypothetical protein
MVFLRKKDVRLLTDINGLTANLVFLATSACGAKRGLWKQAAQALFILDACKKRLPSP